MLVSGEVDITPSEIRGAAFGLRQALDTVGAFLGPLIAIGLMVLLHDRFRSVFWVAVIPAALAVLVLALFVREPGHVAHRTSQPVVRAAIGALGARYWWLVAVAGLFTLARFSEAFLILKASAAGLGAAYIPAVLVIMNVTYSLSAYPAGWLSDRVNRWAVLAAGSLLLIAADLVLAFTATLTGALIGIAIWGLHMGFTQGLFAALVADTADASQRGTAFGVFNLVSGIALLAASVLAGLVWDRYGPQATFVAGAAITIVAGLAAIGLYIGGRLGPVAKASRANPR